MSHLETPRAPAIDVAVPEPVGPEGTIPAAVDRVLAAMRAPGAEPMSLGDMADLACLSPFHFSRVFRRVTGVSPVAFSGALRLDRAKRLLLSSELSVTEVCFALGYESLGSFTTRFTRQVGLSPGRFRRLPERTTVVLGALQDASDEWFAWPWPDGRRTVTGRVIAPGDGGGATFVGLFPIAAAQGMPVAGTVIPRAGPFRLPLPTDGRYALLAVSLPVGCDAVKALAPDGGALVGSAGAPLIVRQGRVSGPTEVRLRPFLPTDTPVLVALPPLLFGTTASGSTRPVSAGTGKIREVACSLLPVP